LQNAFGTIDWKKIKEEIKPFRITMEQGLLKIKT